MKARISLQNQQIEDLRKSIQQKWAANHRTPVESIPRQPVILPKIKHVSVQKNTANSFYESKKRFFKSESQNEPPRAQRLPTNQTSLRSLHRPHRSNQYEHSKPLKMPAKCRHPPAKLIGSGHQTSKPPL